MSAFQIPRAENLSAPRLNFKFMSVKETSRMRIQFIT